MPDKNEPEEEVPVEDVAEKLAEAAEALEVEPKTVLTNAYRGRS